MNNLSQCTSLIQEAATTDYPELLQTAWLPQLIKVSNSKRQLVYRASSTIFSDASFTFSVNLSILLGRQLKIDPKIIAKNIVLQLASKINGIRENQGFNGVTKKGD